MASRESNSFCAREEAWSTFPGYRSAAGGVWEGDRMRVRHVSLKIATQIEDFFAVLLEDLSVEEQVECSWFGGGSGRCDVPDGNCG